MLKKDIDILNEQKTGLENFLRTNPMSWALREKLCDVYKRIEEIENSNRLNEEYLNREKDLAYQRKLGELQAKADYEKTLPVEYTPYYRGKWAHHGHNGGYGEWVSKDVLEMDSKEIVCFVTESLKEAYETQKKLQSEFNGDFYTKEI